MIIRLIRYIKGYVKFQVSGYSPERFINACKYRNIKLWGLFSRKGTYEMYTSVYNFKKLKPIIRKTGTKVMIIERFGLPFFFYRYRKRKIFFAGAIAAIILIYVMSLLVWNIDVRGNISRTDETIIHFLEENNIKQGMWKSQLDCSRIVKDLRKEFDDIIWVSASIKGSCLFIQIKENDAKEFALQETSTNNVTNIIADSDCQIEEIITRQGKPLVSEGDVVKKGDTLVTGVLEVYNDNKEIIGYQLHDSQADIKGKITYNYKNIVPVKYQKKEYGKQVKEELYMRFYNKIFWIGKEKIKEDEHESILEEKQLLLGGFLELPIYIGRKITKPYVMKDAEYMKEELKSKLINNLKKTYDDLEKKGVEIIENDVKIYNECNFAIAKGTLTLICDIGEKEEAKIPKVPVEEELNGND